MKELIIIVVTSLSLVLTVCGVQVYQNKVENDLMFNNKTIVNILLNEDIDGDIFINYLKNLSGDVTVSKYVRIDDENVIVYTNDMTMNGILKSGELQIEEPTEQFIASYDSGEKEQLAKFNLYTPDLNITVRPIEALIKIGTDGHYFFSSTPYTYDVVAEIGAEYGTVEIYAEAHQTTFFDYLYEVEHLYTGIVLLFLLLAFILIHYGIDRGKKIGVLKVQGLALVSILQKMVREFTSVVIYGSVVGGLLAVIGTSIISATYSYWLVLLTMYMSMFFAVLLFSMIVLMSTLYIVKTINKVSLLIKGAKPYKVIIFLHLFLKTIFLIFF